MHNNTPLAFEGDRCHPGKATELCHLLCVRSAGTVSAHVADLASPIRESGIRILHIFHYGVEGY